LTAKAGLSVNERNGITLSEFVMIIDAIGFGRVHRAAGGARFESAGWGLNAATAPMPF
jgi:hypothetical protein